MTPTCVVVNEEGFDLVERNFTLELEEMALVLGEEKGLLSPRLKRLTARRVLPEDPWRGDLDRATADVRYGEVQATVRVLPHIVAGDESKVCPISAEVQDGQNEARHAEQRAENASD